MVSPLVLFYAFAVGVSFAATFVVLSYIAWGYQASFWRPHTKDDEKEPSIPIAQPFLYILVRLSYGLGNVVNVLLGNTITSAILVGIVLGGVFVAFSHKFNLPKILFGLKSHSGWFNVLIPITFALIFAVIIRSLNDKFILL